MCACVCVCVCVTFCGQSLYLYAKNKRAITHIPIYVISLFGMSKIVDKFILTVREVFICVSIIIVLVVILANNANNLRRTKEYVN